MNVGDLVKFRCNTAHYDRAYLIVEIEVLPERGTFVRLAGEGPSGSAPMPVQQFPAWRLERVT